MDTCGHGFFDQMTKLIENQELSHIFSIKSKQDQESCELFQGRLLCFTQPYYNNVHFEGVRLTCAMHLALSA